MVQYHRCREEAVRLVHFGDELEHESPPGETDQIGYDSGNFIATLITPPEEQEDCLCKALGRLGGGPGEQCRPADIPKYC